MAPVDIPRPAPARLPQTGLALIVLSACSYGIQPVFMRFAYDAGAGTMALLALRYVAAAAVLAAVVRLSGRSFLLPAGRRMAGVVTGCYFAVTGSGYLGSVRLIPVSFAVLLAFTYPILVAIVSALRGEPMGMRRVGALCAAFVGLALALGIELGELNPLGVAFGLASAIAYTIAIFHLGRATRDTDPLVVNLHAMATCAVIFLPLAAGAGELTIPGTTLGVVGILGMTVTYFTGVVAFFAAVPRIGTVKTAFLSQLEPVVSITSAMLILGEQLTPVQGFGVVLLFAAVLVLTR
ncbi:MAG TPA: DMT family transporter [Stellaceae bacterium]|nr:DMT family transporter [Stellaceae bacterium]